MKRLFGEDLEDKFEEFRKPNAVVNPVIENVSGIELDKKRLIEKFNKDAAYKNVQWNDEFHHSSGPFDQMMRAIKKNWWDRFPTPVELFTMLYAHIEGTLHDDLNDMAKTVKPTPEMTCYAVQFESPTLFVYEKVSGLKYKPARMFSKEKKYFIPRGKFCRDMKTFVINEVEHGDKIPLGVVNRRNPAVVEYFYGRSFDDIPDIVKDEGPSIYFPDDKEAWMVVKEGPRHPFDLNLAGVTAYGKGVRER